MPPDNWLYHYQTLTTGILAVVVGAVTTGLLWRQIRQTDQALRQANEQNSQQLKRQLRAFRAGLPIALTQIHQYSNECIGVLLHTLKLFPTGDDEVLHSAPSAPTPSAPTYPADAFTVLQGTIEFADAADAAKLARIIAYSQIQHSRFSSLFGRVYKSIDPDFIVTRSNVLYGIRDAVGMRLHIDTVYDYGRETEPHIHELGLAERAAEVLLTTRDGATAAPFVREHWPPDFPRRMNEV